MAKSRGSGDWLVLEELLERGDPSFVDRLRAFHDAEILASFAPRWYGDRRPAARRFLLEYLDQPLDAYRHEPLVKRLFKQAEAAGDDEVMARFLVLFDRALRREEKPRRHYEQRQVGSEAEARALSAAWEVQGLENVGFHSWFQDRQQRWMVYGSWAEPRLATPQGTTIPRGRSKFINPRTGEQIPDNETQLGRWYRRALAGKPVTEGVRRKLVRMRLFTVATRQYLRRRAWRYFRKLGRLAPERYVQGVSQALLRYVDQDTPDGLALIDNWSLIHILFHRSPVLLARPSGWSVAEGRSLAELAPAPIYEPLWAAAPRAIVDLLLGARSRPVRHWTLQMARRHDSAGAAITVEELLGLLSHEDSDLVAFATERLAFRDLGAVSMERWLALIETANPSALEALVSLMRQQVAPWRLSFDQLVRLTISRPLPVARLGLDWLSDRPPCDGTERTALLALVESECERLRPEIVRLVRERLATVQAFDSGWLLEFLDSRHTDVRAEGFAWFRSEPRARDDVSLWRRLIESPYDDIRLGLVVELEERIAGQDGSRLQAFELSPDDLRWLWASVLLNVHRGARAKSTVVRQLIARLERRPGELESLLPLLAVALRSSRGPERRAGLAALASLAEHRAEAGPRIELAFPELKWR
jgi:hypothetical protein